MVRRKNEEGGKDKVPSVENKNNLQIRKRRKNISCF